MYRVLPCLRAEDDAFGLRSVERVLPVPAVGYELVLREVVQPSYHGRVLDPYEQLGEFHARFPHAFAEREYHLVRIEDVDGIFLREIGERRSYPALGKTGVGLIALQFVVFYGNVCPGIPDEALLRFHVADSVGWIGNYCVSLPNLLEQEAYYVFLAGISAYEDVIPKEKSISDTYLHAS